MRFAVIEYYISTYICIYVRIVVDYDRERLSSGPPNMPPNRSAQSSGEHQFIFWGRPNAGRIVFSNWTGDCGRDPGCAVFVLYFQCTINRDQYGKKSREYSHPHMVISISYVFRYKFYIRHALTWNIKNIFMKTLIVIFRKIIKGDAFLTLRFYPLDPWWSHTWAPSSNEPSRLNEVVCSPCNGCSSTSVPELRRPSSIVAEDAHFSVQHFLWHLNGQSKSEKWNVRRLKKHNRTEEVRHARSLRSYAQSHVDWDPGTDIIPVFKTHI